MAAATPAMIRHAQQAGDPGHPRAGGSTRESG
jgi:hypothetical protein